MSFMPEHEKVRRTRPNADLIRDFLDHVEKERGIVLAEADLCHCEQHDALRKTDVSLQELLYEFFGIDYEKLAAEDAQIAGRSTEIMEAMTREKRP